MRKGYYRNKLISTAFHFFHPNRHKALQNLTKKGLDCNSSDDYSQAVNEGLDVAPRELCVFTETKVYQIVSKLE